MGVSAAGWVGEGEASCGLAILPSFHLARPNQASGPACGLRKLRGVVQTESAGWRFCGRSPIRSRVVATESQEAPDFWELNEQSTERRCASVGEG
jgi:hypothetical protein